MLKVFFAKSVLSPAAWFDCRLTWDAGDGDNWASVLTKALNGIFPVERLDGFLQVLRPGWAAGVQDELDAAGVVDWDREDSDLGDWDAGEESDGGDDVDMSSSSHACPQQLVRNVKQRTAADTQSLWPLLEEAQSLLDQCEFEDPSSFSGAIERLGANNPELAQQADRLVQEFARDERSLSFNDLEESKAEIIQLLKVVLADTDVKHKQIRFYAYKVTSRAKRHLTRNTDGRLSPQAGSLIDPVARANLFKEALDNIQSGSSVEDISRSVQKMSCKPGQVKKDNDRRKKRKVLKERFGPDKIRQRVDWQSGEVKLVIYEDIKQECWPSGMPDVEAESIATARANEVWQADCFLLQTYLVQEWPERFQTAAEAYSEWIQQGWTQSACKKYLKNLAKLPQDCNRRVPASWLQRRRQELREQLQSTTE